MDLNNSSWSPVLRELGCSKPAGMHILIRDGGLIFAKNLLRALAKLIAVTDHNLSDQTDVSLQCHTCSTNNLAFDYQWKQPWYPTYPCILINTVVGVYVLNYTRYCTVLYGTIEVHAPHAQCSPVQYRTWFQKAQDWVDLFNISKFVSSTQVSMLGFSGGVIWQLPFVGPLVHLDLYLDNLDVHLHIYLF